MLLAEVPYLQKQTQSEVRQAKEQEAKQQHPQLHDKGEETELAAVVNKEGDKIDGGKQKVDEPGLLWKLVNMRVLPLNVLTIDGALLCAPENALVRVAAFLSTEDLTFLFNTSSWTRLHFVHSKVFWQGHAYTCWYAFALCCVCLPFA
jgi:hypothetical protein